MRVFGHYAYVFLSSVGLAHVMFYIPAMPNPMASHFDYGGTADGWSSPLTFLIATGVVFILITLIFVLAPLMAPRIPDSLIRVPGKEYWFAPERRDKFWKLVVSRIVWAGNITLIFFSLVLHLVFLANMEPTPKLNGFAAWSVVAGYFCFVIFWIVALFRRLSKGAQA